MEISTQQAIAASEKVESGMQWAKKIAEWGETKGKWVADSTKWIQKKAETMAHRMKDFAIRRAEFMTKMAAWTIRFKKFMAMVAKFMPIIKVMLIIIMIFTNFLQYVIMLIAALFIGLLLVIFKILSVPGIIYIPAALYWFIADFIPFLVYFIVYMVILVFITVICALLAAGNKLFGGIFENLIHCENGPASWYQTVNWHFNNKFNRGLFCSKPCRPGYRPDITESFCEKNDKKAADFCPQAQVMRIWSGYNRSDSKFAYRDFDDNSNMKYRMKMPEDRERMIKDFFLKRKKFFEACEDKMTQYDHVTLGICSNLDVIEKNGLYGLKKPEIAKLQKVCNQAFCTPGKSYPFCSALANTSKVDDDILLKLLVKFGIGLVVFVVVFVTLVRIIKEF
jgi:hypothetical protein